VYMAFRWPHQCPKRTESSSKWILFKLLESLDPGGKARHENLRQFLKECVKKPFEGFCGRIVRPKTVKKAEDVESANKSTSVISEPRKTLHARGSPADVQPQLQINHHLGDESTLDRYSH
jgi:hypothetical protein